jgi:hypothetical protein
MFTFIAWIILFILCWPLAILALVLYPVFWILTLPFRLLGIAVDGVFGFKRHHYAARQIAAAVGFFPF